MCMNQFKENRLSKLRRYKREQAVVQSVPIRPTNFLENASVSVCLFVSVDRLEGGLGLAEVVA